MITELIAITRDCVNACRLVLQSRQVQEIRGQAQSQTELRNFRRPYLPTNPAAQEEMKQVRALFLQGKIRSDISKELDIPYSTVCQYIRGYVGRVPEIRDQSKEEKIKKIRRVSTSTWAEQAKELYTKMGQSASDISVILNVPYSSVYGVLCRECGYQRLAKKEEKPTTHKENK